MSQQLPKASVEARWCVELYVDCPACDDTFDALDTPDFWDGRHFDIGECRTERTKDIEIRCPECRHEFTFNIGLP